MMMFFPPTAHHTRRPRPRIDNWTSRALLLSVRPYDWYSTGTIPGTGTSTDGRCSCFLRGETMTMTAQNAEPESSLLYN